MKIKKLASISLLCAILIFCPLFLSACKDGTNPTATEYTITFDKRSGTGGSDSVAAVYNSPMPTATKPTREFHIFLGYFSEINGGGTQYYDADMQSLRVWDKKEDSTLFAHWLAEYTGVVINLANYSTFFNTSISFIPAGPNDSFILYSITVKAPLNIRSDSFVQFVFTFPGNGMQTFINIPAANVNSGVSQPSPSIAPNFSLGMATATPSACNGILFIKN